MRRQAANLAVLSYCLAAGAFAQASAPPQASDTWARPAAASSARYGEAPRAGTDSGPDRFKFKDRRPALPPAPAANPFDKAPISGGAPQIGPDGRPALNCAQSPMDPRCR